MQQSASLIVDQEMFTPRITFEPRTLVLETPIDRSCYRQYNSSLTKHSLDFQAELETLRSKFIALERKYILREQQNIKRIAEKQKMIDKLNELLKSKDKQISDLQSISLHQHNKKQNNSVVERCMMILQELVSDPTQLKEKRLIKQVNSVWALSKSIDVNCIKNKSKQLLLEPSICKSEHWIRSDQNKQNRANYLNVTHRKPRKKSYCDFQSQEEETQVVQLQSNNQCPNHKQNRFINDQLYTMLAVQACALEQYCTQITQ